MNTFRDILTSRTLRAILEIVSKVPLLPLSGEFLGTKVSHLNMDGTAGRAGGNR